ncbi:MAG: phosphatidylserine/phosphatidylglycerophosphate/cardiolipin synthase family protein [Elusimicrobiota bacterium]|jgi:cardiolipin synthase
MIKKTIALTIASLIIPSISSAGSADLDSIMAQVEASGLAAGQEIELPSDIPQAKAGLGGGTIGEQAGVAWGYGVSIYHAIAGQITDSGVLPWTAAAPDFEEISKRVLLQAAETRYMPRKGGSASLLEDEGFIRELEQASGARFTAGNDTDYLIDGPESFAAKDALIMGARESVFVASWAFYDDETGYAAADLLIEAKRRGVDVRVMVDGKVALSHGPRALKRMERAGIEVLRYQEIGRRHDIWHVKTSIADWTTAITGGMNFGNVYSHRGDGPRWRDTDVRYSGPAAYDTAQIFRSEWNAQVAARPGSGLTLIPAPPARPGSYGSARIAPVLQNPPTDSKILLSMIKAMYGASREINVENAYFVALPAVTRALLDALERGVKVNVLTNSPDSLNGQCKSMGVPLLKSLVALKAEGAGVYLKQGDTLHSKFMTVDGVFANVGSYNLHPRGERYDTELNVNILGREGVAELDRAFLDDIAAAKRIDRVEDLDIRETWLSRFIEEYFMAQLARKK